MPINKDAPGFFSISEGGPVHQLLLKIRLEKKEGKLALLALCITWLPLVIITLIEGTLYAGVQIPFLQDVAMQVRLLLALPMLILIRFFIDDKVTIVIEYLSETLVSAEDRQRVLPKVLNRVRRLTNSAMAEIIMLLVVIALTISPIKGGMLSGIHREAGLWLFDTNVGGSALSYAGNWAVYISIPIFQFILIRWLWRYIVWVLLLFRISRMRLNLQSTHPDRAGGLGIILLAQRYFILFFVALSTVISGELIAQLLMDPASFTSIRSEVIGYIILCLLLVLFPMIFFTGKLIKTKHEGLVKLSTLGTSLSSKFENEWVNDTTIEKKLSESMASTSTVQDYSTIFRSLDQLRPVPVTLKDILNMSLLLFLPYTPIIFIHFSIGELLQKLIGLLV